mmetsp:Transcript_13484/g.13211  ORF Transcript_13484/g.13211 Transcript_13484/m.13211 type:complete len:243 (+) Transcript_13484:221-949(+)
MHKAEEIKEYMCFQTEPSMRAGVCIYVHNSLCPRLINQYSTKTITLQLSTTETRLFLIGAYVEHGGRETLQSIKQEIANIKDNFINPNFIVGGDFNEFLRPFRNFAAKNHIQTTYFNSTFHKNFMNGEDHHSELDLIATNGVMEEQEAHHVEWTDHDCVRVRMSFKMQKQRYIGTHWYHRKEDIKRFLDGMRNFTFVEGIGREQRRKIPKNCYSAKLGRRPDEFSESFKRRFEAEKLQEQLE